MKSKPGFWILSEGRIFQVERAGRGVRRETRGRNGNPGISRDDWRSGLFQDNRFLRTQSDPGGGRHHDHRRGAERSSVFCLAQ